MHDCPHQKSGFTLAELLIALAILGVIAAFIIPKLLVAQQDQKRIAIFKETIAILGYNANMYCQSGIKDTTLSLFDYYSQQVNSVKQCPTNGITEGCIATNSYATEGAEGAITLANGAAIGGINLSHYLGAEGMIVDWNGLDGANTAGDDQIRIYMLTTCTGTWNGVRAPRIGAATIDPTSLSLYQTIFQ